MSNQLTPVELMRQASDTAAMCNCRLLPPAPSKVCDLMQEWLADHPGHTRKQHVFAYDFFKWLERRSIGGIQDE